MIAVVIGLFRDQFCTRQNGIMNTFFRCLFLLLFTYWPANRYFFHCGRDVLTTMLDIFFLYLTYSDNLLLDIQWGLKRFYLRSRLWVGFLKKNYFNFAVFDIFLVLFYLLPAWFEETLFGNLFTSCFLDFSYCPLCFLDRLFVLKVKLRILLICEGVIMLAERKPFICIKTRRIRLGKSCKVLFEWTLFRRLLAADSFCFKMVLSLNTERFLNGFLNGFQRYSLGFENRAGFNLVPRR